MDDADDDVLDLADIQGNILRPYGFRHGGYLTLAVTEPAGARRWLAGLEVTTAAPWPEDRRLDVAVNVALSHAGLAALGVPDRLLATFPAAFREGMRSRAPLLGDIGPSAPERWDEGLRGEGHVVVMVHGREPDIARDRLAELEAEVGATGGAVAVVHHIRCDNLAKQREHFGFTDGFAQPAVEGSGHDHLPGQGQPRKHDGWRLLKPGEFVLGYEDEDGVRSPPPAPPLGHNGSYMVLRKLEQRVAAFRRYVADTADAFGLERDLVAAKLVGRWRDGTPLALSPDRPDGRISASRTAINDFRYADDPDGYRCPIGAHIRRVNPRDALDPSGERTKRHRMIRRGMPYGEPLTEEAEGAEDADGGRGLVFVCFVASIERQFEDVQREWCNDGDAFGLGRDRDFVAGRPPTGDEPSTKLTVQGRAPLFFPEPPEPLVLTRGGEYLFTPGVRALRALAAADW